MNDVIEFYNEESGGMLTSIKSSIVPRPGDLISVNKETWEVAAVTFAVDYSDMPFSERKMRANIDLRPVKRGRGK